MNLNAYMYQKKILLVDLGITFENNSSLGIEALMSDVSFLEERKKDIVGLMITHAHEDHYGAIPYVWDKLQCPIYVTPFAAEMLKFKLKEARINPQVIQVRENNEMVEAGPYRVRWIRTMHSIPEACSLAITTDAGTVLHSGDWNFDEGSVLGIKPPKELFKELGDAGVLATVCDSTNIFYEAPSGSESDVDKSLMRWVQASKGKRVVVTCFASNVARIRSCLVAAKATGREVFLVGTSVKRACQIAFNMGWFKDLPKPSEEKLFPKMERGKVMVICAGSQGELRAGMSRLAYGRFDRLYLEQEDVVLFSSRVIPGNERTVADLHNQLLRINAKLVLWQHDNCLHVSGHPSRKELKEFYALLRPKMSIPVHGEGLHLKEHVSLVESLGIHGVYVENGSVIELNATENLPARIGILPTSRIFKDGKRMLPRFGKVVTERERLASSGTVQLGVLIGQNSTYELLMNVTGLWEEKEEEVGEQKMQERVERDIDKFFQRENPLTQPHVLATVLEEGLGQFTMYEWGKLPVVTVHVFALPFALGDARRKKVQAAAAQGHVD